MWIEPKTDWNSDDYYNAEDINRVEVNAQFVASYLRGLQYMVPPLVSTEDRTMASLDFISSINRVEGNIEALAASFLVPPGYQPRRAWFLGMGFDYRDATRWESNIRLLYEWAVIAKDNRIFCGTFAAGEEGVIY